VRGAPAPTGDERFGMALSASELVEWGEFAEAQVES